MHPTAIVQPNTINNNNHTATSTIHQTLLYNMRLSTFSSKEKETRPTYIHTHTHSFRCLVILFFVSLFTTALETPARARSFNFVFRILIISCCFFHFGCVCSCMVGSRPHCVCMYHHRMLAFDTSALHCCLGKEWGEGSALLRQISAMDSGPLGGERTAHNMFGLHI